MLAMGHLAPGEIFENMLRLKRFGLYLVGILNRKWLFFHIIEIVISAATEMLGGSVDWLALHLKFGSVYF